MTPLETARAKLDRAERAYETALRMLCQAATEYAKEGTKDYAAAHPRREVAFVAAMGSTTFWVSRNGRESGDLEYMLKGSDADKYAGHVIKPPVFLERLWEIEDAQSFPFALGGDLNFKCKGREVLSDLTDW